MVRQEWKKLFHNKGMMVVLAAIAVIPAIYTTLFLGSMWDPYGKVDQLPVAVVNEDKSAEYNGKTLNIGEDLVENLKKNDSLQFNFVSSSAAKEGLDNGTFYMTITIPEDFSQNAATVLKKEPEKMQLQYETNPGTNYIASKMSDSALEKIKESVSAEVTEQYAHVMLENFEDISAGMTDAAEGEDQIKAGLQQASAGSGTLNSGLKVLSDSALEFQEGSETLNVSLKDYTSGVEKVNNGIMQLTKGAGVMKSTVDNGASRISKGAETLGEGIDKYTGSVHEIYEGTDQLQKNTEALLQGTRMVSEGLKDSEQGSKQLTNGLKELSDTIGSRLEEANGKTEAVTKNLDSLKSGISSLDGELREMEEQFSQKGDSEAAAALNRLMNSQEYQSLTENSAAVTEGAKTSVNALTGAVDSIKDTLDRNLIPAGDRISQGLSSLYGAVAGKGGLQEGITAYAKGVSGINDGLSLLDENSFTLKAGMKSLDVGIRYYTKGVTEGTDTLLQAVSASGNGTQKLADANKDLLQGNDKLTNGAAQIAKGSNELLDGGRALGGGIQELYDGSEKLGESLEKGAAEIQSIYKGETNADMLAQPVDAVKSEASVVPDNGHAMAPYMMCVGLWVACIAFCLMYSLTDSAGRITSGFRWWFSKISVPAVVLTAASAVMVSALWIFNGFRPQRPGAVFAVAFLAGLSFMSVIYFFNMLFGKVGSFLMLIFMVIQLAGAAGTYPVEVSADFVSVIHKWLPFSYGVDAFRKAICGRGSLYMDVKVLAVFAMVFGVCSLIVFELRTVRIRQGKECLTEKLKIG